MARTQTWSLLPGALAVLLAASSCAPAPDAGDTRAAAAAPASAPAKAIAGRAAYDEARAAVGAGDVRGALRAFERAISENDGCAEYWYNQGAAQANLAIEVVNQDEDEAVRLFTASVDSKRRAVALMDAARFCFYDEAAQRQVRSDAEQGLAGVDEVLADRPSLIAALHLYAGG